jgi:hypothetical protein
MPMQDTGSRFPPRDLDPPRGPHRLSVTRTLGSQRVQLLIRLSARDGNVGYKSE